MIAKIAVSAANFAIDKPYSYYIPEEMTLTAGMRVMVPFGRGNRRAEGIVLSVEEGDCTGLKPVEQALDQQPLLTDTMLRLAAFLRERYFCTFFDAVRVMLPTGLWFQHKDIFSLTQDLSWQESAVRQKDAAAILQMLSDCGGAADGAQLRAVVEEESAFEKAIAYLLRKKWITAQQEFLRKTADKTQMVATLAVPSEEALEYAHSRPKSAALQRSVLELMCSVGTAAVKEICYFTGAKSATVKRLAEMGFLTLSYEEVLRCRQIQPVQLTGPLVLNEEQHIAYTGLCRQMQAQTPGVALLFGVTGSGKTAVYIKLIQRCIDEGKQAMLLVPEIALTPQLLGLLAAYFGETIAVLHSSLPVGERYDQWKRIRSGQAKVVVGTRSAVFAPCSKLGLLILDEEQEHSYQSENTPRYHAKEVAMWRGVREQSLILLGSATPSVETMYHAKAGDYRLYTLGQRYNGKPLPKVEIVDMREQLCQGNDLALSYPLLDALRRNADAGKQAILFLNRRGNSRALVCVDCREAPECPRCSARLTYHSANQRLMCHYCGFSQPVTQQCPVCGGAMKQIGVGTQKVQQQLQAVFPDMEVDRMDADTVSATTPHEKILSHFANNKVPVLIGTQMVAKGLNLPDVTLVGVLDADLGLYTDSYRAAETTFNMLTQVIGRAGRGDTGGQAMIQTMVPEHKVIGLAARQDYEGFYALEINLRRVQQCPPFADLAMITFTGQEEARVLRGAVKFRDSLAQCLKEPAYAQPDSTVLGPAPCPVVKINHMFRYRLTLRCKMQKSMRLLLAHLLRQFAQDKENRGLSAYIDINGFD